MAFNSFTNNFAGTNNCGVLLGPSLLGLVDIFVGYGEITMRCREIERRSP